MKSEHRRELKVNTLDQALAKMPSRAKQHIPTVLMIVAGLLIGFAIRYRMNMSAQRITRAGDDLAVVRLDIAQIKNFATAPDSSFSDELYKDAASRLDSILSQVGSSDPKIAAEALVARGDLDWNMSGVAAATTQPSFAEQSPADLQASAQAAYQAVISTYPKQDFAVCTARFGLAAIAENHGDWDGARAQYQSVLDDAAADEVMQSQARGLLGSLDELKNPPVIGQVASAPVNIPPAHPTTQP